MRLTERFRRTGLDATTIVSLLVVFALAVLHHLDHVLRVDHSGWPFRSNVTPFTFSLLAYPVLVFALWGSRRLFWWRWAALAIAAFSTLAAHLLIETPTMQFAMWAHNKSLDARSAAETHNLLNVQSVSFGVAAVVLSMTLNVAVLFSVGAMLIAGLRQRRSDARAARTLPIQT